MGRLAAGAMLTLLVFGGPVRADDPLPPPRVMPGASGPPAYFPPPLVYYPPPTAYRHSAYEHWQYLGPNRFGYWKPRVAYMPTTAFYRATGQPYPWVVTHVTEYMPYAPD